jgi:hypothetical protein
MARCPRVPNAERPNDAIQNAVIDLEGLDDTLQQLEGARRDIGTALDAARYRDERLTYADSCERGAEAIEATLKKVRTLACELEEAKGEILANVDLEALGLNGNRAPASNVCDLAIVAALRRGSKYFAQCPDPDQFTLASALQRDPRTFEGKVQEMLLSEMLRKTLPALDEAVPTLMRAMAENIRAEVRRGKAKPIR